jgi:hypothetical protein
VVRVRFEREVDIAAPASTVWDYLVDWPRQGDWIPQTRVEKVDAADGLGGRFRAWSGLGTVAPGATRGISRRGVGFWDPMTITAWERTPDGGGRCEVLHLGQVVKGEGEFTVVASGEHASRFVWAELPVLPLGRLGALGWPAVRPVATSVIDRALRTMRDQVEESVRSSAG